MRFTLLFIIYYLHSCANAQTKNNISLNIDATYNENKLQFDSINYQLPNAKDSIVFTNFKFYITNIKLLNNSKIVYAEKASYHLIDVKKNIGLQIKLAAIPKVKFNTLVFNLGVDSITNASGVRGGDLDPTQGMYWAWHSGYINLKLEGNSKLCNTRNNAFEFHLGGFQHPYNSLQKVVLSIKNTKKNIINIDADIYKFISSIDLKSTNQIMTPSKQAVDLSKKITSIFSIKN